LNFTEHEERRQKAERDKLMPAQRGEREKLAAKHARESDARRSAAEH
jgi:hypothetical protein